MPSKNKRKHPSLDEVLERPWCYYCERDFDDLKILINHQKAKHMKCPLCPRRLNTAGGLSVHMQQVHKETLKSIENTLPHRSDPMIEIFGIEGIPEAAMEDYRNKRTQKYYEDEAMFYGRTGNGPSGQGAPASKKVKVETSEELRKRLAEHKAKKAAGELGTGSGPSTPGVKTEIKAESPDVQIKAESPFEGPPLPGSPANMYNPAFAQPPAASPPMGLAPPNVQPTNPYQPPPPYPYPGPHMGFAGPPPGPPGPYPGFAGSPPPGGQFPPYGMPQPPPFQQPFAPQFSAPPALNGFAHHVPGPKPASKPVPSGGPPRQNSLPSSASLPARPAFDAPPVSRSQLHEMHQGQKPLTDNHEASAISSGVDDLIAEAQTQGPDNGGVLSGVGESHVANHEVHRNPTTPEAHKPLDGAPNGSHATNGDLSAKQYRPDTTMATPPASDKVQRTETSKSSHSKGEKTKKRTVLVIKDEAKTPEEKMAAMGRYSFAVRPRKPLVITKA